MRTRCGRSVVSCDELRGPRWLAALLLIPLAVVATVLARRRARRYVIRFPAMESLRAAGARSSSWRRWLPQALLLAAVAALVFAIARPHVTDTEQRHTGSVMLILDESGSMASTDVQPTRSTSAAQHAATQFIDEPA